MDVELFLYCEWCFPKFTNILWKKILSQVSREAGRSPQSSPTESALAKDSVRAPDIRYVWLCLITTGKGYFQRLIRAARHRYWIRLIKRIQCCADTSDLHGMYQGINGAIGPTYRKTAIVINLRKQLDLGQSTSATCMQRCACEERGNQCTAADFNASRVRHGCLSRRGESWNQISKRQQIFGS